MTTALAGGRYELGPVLGTGGMAQVRRATDTVLGRDVAVKLFREDLDEQSADRVRNEMQTLAALTHPHLVAVHDAGTRDHGQPYLVMELVEGPTLGERCQDGSLTSDEVATIGADLAAALAYVHGRGVVHRDVKPANVLLSTHGAKLADFGIARIVDSVGHTGTGLTIGTAPYLAPEQVTGEPVGPPADIYALGLVLLECLTGRREYAGVSLEAALARLNRQPSVPDHLPAPWPGLLRAMTARLAAERPSAEEVALVLRGGTLGVPDLQVTEAFTVSTALPNAGTTVLTPTPTSVLERPTLGLPPRVLTRDAPVRRRRTALAVAGTVTGTVAGAALVALLVAAVSSDPPRSETPKSPLEQHISQLQDEVRR